MLVQFSDLQEAILFLQTNTGDTLGSNAPSSKVVVWTPIGGEVRNEESEYYELLLHKTNVIGIAIDFFQFRDKVALRSYIMQSKITFFLHCQPALLSNDIRQLSLLLKSSNVCRLTLVADSSWNDNNCINVLFKENPQINRITIMDYEDLQINPSSPLIQALKNNCSLKCLELQDRSVTLEALQILRELMYEKIELQIRFIVDNHDEISFDQWRNFKALSLSKIGLNNDTVYALSIMVLRSYIEKTDDHKLSKKDILEDQISKAITPEAINFCKEKMLKNAESWFDEETTEERNDLLEKAGQVLPSILFHFVYRTTTSLNVLRHIKAFLKRDSKDFNDIPPNINHGENCLRLDELLEKSAANIGIKEYIAAKFRQSLEQQKSDLGWIRELYYQKCSETLQLTLRDRKLSSNQPKVTLLHK